MYFSRKRDVSYLKDKPTTKIYPTHFGGPIRKSIIEVGRCRLKECEGVNDAGDETHREQHSDKECGGRRNPEKLGVRDKLEFIR